MAYQTEWIRSYSTQSRRRIVELRSSQLSIGTTTPFWIKTRNATQSPYSDHIGNEIVIRNDRMSFLRAYCNSRRSLHCSLAVWSNFSARWRRRETTSLVVSQSNRRQPRRIRWTALTWSTVDPLALVVVMLQKMRLRKTTLESSSLHETATGICAKKLLDNERTYLQATLLQSGSSPINWQASKKRQCLAFIRSTWR